MNKKNKQKRRSYVVHKTMYSYYRAFLKKHPKSIRQDILTRKQFWSGAFSRAREHSEKMVVLAESFLHSIGNPTIILEDEPLVEMLFNAKSEVSFEDIRIPNGGAYFAFPKMSVEGVPLVGCSIVRATQQFLADAFPLPVIPKGPIDEYNAAKDKEWITFHFHQRDGSTIITFATPAEFHVYLQGTTTPTSSLCQTTEREGRLKRILGRLCCMTCLYMSAYPESHFHGIPKRSVGLNRGSDHCRTVKINPSLKPRTGYVSTHWRTWTFRSLRHERFRRNPDGSVRVIFVSPCIVHKPLDPITVENVAQSKREGASL